MSVRPTEVAAGLLGGHPASIALHDADRAVTYGELARLVAEEASRLGPHRRVVPVTMSARLDAVVALLGAFEAGHPVLLLAPGADDRRRQQPMLDLVDAADELHPDLALLLSTSGSTGSPKLVRLSRENVLSNARAIADYLGLGPDDRAITSLPLHYCYGLSVLTSHLVAGAGVVLSELSVADACFWDAVEQHAVTGFAGVPYTFELWEHSGHRAVPASLRYVTQAGGRMHPDRVRGFAELGEQHGFDLVVMYGQTEATARMAYLPPHLAAACPEAIGIPIPGGSLRLDPLPGAEDGAQDGVGELVYAGPNVMMGYATQAADLARGPELTELRTGDLGRQRDDGLWEVVGRRDRHAKVFGLRLDLDRVESLLAEPAWLHARGERLVAFHERPRRGDRVRAEIAAATGLPASAIVVHRVETLPRTSSGKPDRADLGRQAALLVEENGEEQPATDGSVTPEAVRDLLALCLHRPDAGMEDSFVDLGGDSLSFVEVSTRLSARLGGLPPGWQHLSARDLAALATRPRRGVRQVEISTLLRAGAILAIVVAHVDLWLLLGGAHVLLAVAGYNLARFQLATPGRRRRVRAVLGGVARCAVPASLWIVLAALVTGNYDLRTALYLTNLLGSDTWSADWQFWFLEVFVWSGLAVAAAVAVPVVDRVQRRRPFGTAIAVAIACLALRYATVGVSAESIERYALPHVLWCVALGGAAALARSRRDRLVVLALTVVGCAGFFVDDPQRQLVLALGISLLLLDRGLWLPTPIAAAAALLARASLWIYLTHWQVYPSLEAAGHPWVALAASLAVGLVAERCYALVLSRPGGRRRTPRGACPARST